MQVWVTAISATIALAQDAAEEQNLSRSLEMSPVLGQLRKMAVDSSPGMSPGIPPSTQQQAGVLGGIRSMQATPLSPQQSATSSSSPDSRLQVALATSSHVTHGKAPAPELQGDEEGGRRALNSSSNSANGKGYESSQKDTWSEFPLLRLPPSSLFQRRTSPSASPSRDKNGTLTAKMRSPASHPIPPIEDTNAAMNHGIPPHRDHQEYYQNDRFHGNAHGHISKITGLPLPAFVNAQYDDETIATLNPDVADARREKIFPNDSSVGEGIPSRSEHQNTHVPRKSRMQAPIPFPVKDNIPGPPPMTAKHLRSPKSPTVVANKNFEGQLRMIYQTYNQEKLHEIPGIIEYWEGREEVLLHELRKKYFDAHNVEDKYPADLFLDQEANSEGSHPSSAAGNARRDVHVRAGEQNFEDNDMKSESSGSHAKCDNNSPYSDDKYQFSRRSLASPSCAESNNELSPVSPPALSESANQSRMAQGSPNKPNRRVSNEYQKASFQQMLDNQLVSRAYKTVDSVDSIGIIRGSNNTEELSNDKSFDQAAEEGWEKWLAPSGTDREGFLADEFRRPVDRGSKRLHALHALHALHDLSWLGHD